MDETRRPATVADCKGCVWSYHNRDDKRCWSLVHARMVPRWRMAATGGQQAVLRPQCYAEDGFTYRAR
jgi:hypothetical protein